MARAVSFSSGSNGNSVFVGDGECGVLIDVGISFARLKNALEECKTDIDSIKALFITHEHSDHIGGLKTFAKKTDIPIYANEKTAEKIISSDCIDAERIHIIECENEIGFSEMSVLPFCVSHDSADAMGYRVRTADNRTVVYSTDTGKVDDKIFSFLENADLNIIEANYDEGMLMCNTSYSFLLKKRISGECGHLSNNDCAETVCKLISGGSRRFMLAHLSEHNNTPDIAFQTVLQRLCENGYVKDRDFELYVAPRGEISRMLIF